MYRFSLTQRHHKVVFGQPVAAVLGAELEGLRFARFVLLTTPSLLGTFAAHADAATRARQAGVFTGAVAHVPEQVATAASAAAVSCNADGIVAFGGGSVLDTAKSVSHRLGLPILAIPTNFSGSEVTWNYGLTRDGRKETMRDPGLLPQVVIYDPRLLLTLPSAIAAASGINAIAHAVEALYAPDANPLTTAAAQAGIRDLVGGLEERRGAQSEAANARCLAGSWLCGEVLSQVGMGLHHRICHVLGGTLGLPHAQTHTVVLPYCVDLNRAHAPNLTVLDELFGAAAPARGLAAFARRLGAPTSLRELGMDAGDIPRAAQLALATPIHNPRPVAVRDVEALLRAAYDGALVH